MTAALEAPGVALTADGLIALRRHMAARSAAHSLTNLPGGFPSRRKGAGQEIADLREYQPGDDLRHLDPATSARRGALHIRQFQQERDRVTLLVADFRAPMFWGVSRALLSVAAAEALCLLGWSAVEEGGRVGLLAITQGAPEVVAPRGRTRGQLEVIGGLVSAHAAALSDVAAGRDAVQPLDAALAVVDRACPPGTDVVIASSFEEEGPALGPALDKIARRRSVRLLLVSDGESLPPGRYPIELGSGARQILQIGSAAAAAPGPAVIAGRSALRLNASAPPDAVAGLLRAAEPGLA